MSWNTGESRGETGLRDKREGGRERQLGFYDIPVSGRQTGD